MSDPRIKTIKIKTGVVKRLTKDKVMYEKEAEQQEAKIEKLKSKGEDEFNIRKQEEVLQETLMMVPSSQRRLQKAFEELSNIVESEKDLAEDPEYLAAVEVLEGAKPHIPA
ncbi:tubulin-specific chaperone A [Nilaparvata lugens]|uniref:tubulin-specific chaperone A n=1 Tax=Nilaparvata lugens TaxID=108931 RepID=UPI000B99898D|nr:tubulin-specific chaperone A [Nilaparvata lugens]